MHDENEGFINSNPSHDITHPIVLRSNVPINIHWQLNYIYWIIQGQYSSGFGEVNVVDILHVQQKFQPNQHTCSNNVNNAKYGM